MQYTIKVTNNEGGVAEDCTSCREIGSDTFYSCFGFQYTGRSLENREETIKALKQRFTSYNVQITFESMVYRDAVKAAIDDTIARLATIFNNTVRYERTYAPDGFTQYGESLSYTFSGGIEVYLFFWWLVLFVRNDGDFSRVTYYYDSEWSDLPRQLTTDLYSAIIRGQGPQDIMNDTDDFYGEE